MGKDVAANWLLRVNCIGHATAWVSHHLVGDKYRNVKLLTHLLDPVEELAKDALAFRELSSARIVDSEGCHYGVYNQYSVLLFNHGSCSLHEQLVESVDSECSSNHDIVQHLLRIQIIPQRNLFDSLGSESILSITV